jgi:hypothetical protein
MRQQVILCSAIPKTGQSCPGGGGGGGGGGVPSHYVATGCQLDSYTFSMAHIRHFIAAVDSNICYVHLSSMKPSSRDSANFTQEYCYAQLEL